MRLQALLPLLFAVIASPALADGPYIVEVTLIPICLLIQAHSIMGSAKQALMGLTVRMMVGAVNGAQAGHQFNPYAAVGSRLSQTLK